jgi:hypothetical protein
MFVIANPAHHATTEGMKADLGKLMGIDDKR